MTGIQRLIVHIEGAVQGVGFRPFVYRLATDLGLKGWVSNGTQGVYIEVEGDSLVLGDFLERLQRDAPPHALIQHIHSAYHAPLGHREFSIRHSDSKGDKTALVLPDIAICADCLQDIFDPTNRRYRYPFTNCTNCGPRYTIIEALPYDRPYTAMKHFPMCANCQAEYENPLDRRFHAQPNACPTCGPHLELWDVTGRVMAQHDEALLGAAQALKAGQIVALKGLGGFHLIVDARHQEGVLELRRRKNRPDKPLAVMYPSLEQIQADCWVSEQEIAVLTSPQAPIVLLKRRKDGLAASVAPNSPILGVMLPYTPLHHLFMAELNFPVVATSGNLSDEPICINEHDALERLRPIADIFLVHNRPIVRSVDDSVTRVTLNKPVNLRRARGYAPLPIRVSQNCLPLLAVGAHLKNTIAISIAHNIFLSQHIGDLETAQTLTAFRNTITSFETLYDFRPAKVACDLHPDYLSTQFAERFANERNLPLVKVQHHYAHALACMAEHNLKPPVLAVVWDGTGYGTDGTVWGGEFLWINTHGFQRVGHFRPFSLVGGEQAIKEPRRSALGLVYEVMGDEAFNLLHESFSSYEVRLFKQMLQKGINTPKTSSVGRIFDGVAALITPYPQVSFEGQAAMQLEYGVDEKVKEWYPYEVTDDTETGTFIVDWRSIIEFIDKDKLTQRDKIAAKFHNTLVQILVDGARRCNLPTLVLSGGCFQNVYLLERAVMELTRAGFQPYWHQQIPTNDGGIALGQIMAAVLEEE